MQIKKKLISVTESRRISFLFYFFERLELLSETTYRENHASKDMRFISDKFSTTLITPYLSITRTRPEYVQTDNTTVERCQSISNIGQSGL
jgi:hypothetical protein